MSTPDPSMVPALEEALYMAIKRIEWLRGRVNRPNPHRKNSAVWRDWENADLEQFDALENELEIFKDLLGHKA